MSLCVLSLLVVVLGVRVALTVFVGVVRAGLVVGGGDGGGVVVFLLLQ